MDVLKQLHVARETPSTRPSKWMCKRDGTSMRPHWAVHGQSRGFGQGTGDLDVIGTPGAIAEDMGAWCAGMEGTRLA